MNKFSGNFPSASGLCDIHFCFYTPEKPKAAVMFSHGMCEYIERYEPFAKFLCDNDIAFFGNDHLGHGDSVTSPETRGFFGSERGYVNMVKDLRRMKVIGEKRLGDLPLFFIGHSMGSFLGRILISKFPEGFRGAVFMGSAGGFMSAAALRAYLEMVIHDPEKGEMTRLESGEKMAFGVFNLRTENPRTPYDWLSRDDADVDEFIADEKCRFSFTAAGYKDLLGALKCCNSRLVFENTPKDLPLLFLSGGMDPIGEYGSGVRGAVIKYMEQGCDINLRIYREARHELLFELNKEEVLGDILEFIVRRA